MTMRKLRWLLLGIATLIHIILFVSVQISTGSSEDSQRAEVFKLVDARLFVPPPPEPPKEEPKEEEIIEIPHQDAPSESFKETDRRVVEVEYVAQHQISVIPEIPTQQILQRIEYPLIARRQGLEGTVFLELYIDSEGVIRDIKVLKDPGYGFAEAAIEAIKDIRVRPAEINGVPTAVRYRYPVRFQLR
ncbi:MAG: energy transducer TonB [Spirochaetaceae bacterium]|nr:MAG: energy transducer TonB [Spirochaetaceae bacterium]